MASETSHRTPTRATGDLLTVGAVADPAAGISGDRMLEIYGAEPRPLQLKSLGCHWAYAFWIVPAMLIAPLVRGRGAWLATITAFVGFAGVSTMPGLLLSDSFDSAVVWPAFHSVFDAAPHCQATVLLSVVSLPLTQASQRAERTA